LLPGGLRSQGHPYLWAWQDGWIESFDGWIDGLKALLSWVKDSLEGADEAEAIKWRASKQGR